MTTAIDPPLFTLLVRSPKDLELLGLEWGMIPQVSGLWSISEIVDGKRRVRHGLIHHVHKQANYGLKNFTPEFFVVFFVVVVFSCHAIHTHFFNRWRIYCQPLPTHFKSALPRKFAFGHFT